ncbi:MAG: hypothetical protein WCB68_23565 [Pyrinomonadaceae bacterium]
MNYFNYFTEIEDTFIKRRGRHLLLGPMDWALIESWKEMGVPLHVALRGIEQSFDSYESKPRKRSVKTLFYCQEEVEAQFAEWLEAQTGAALAENGDGASVTEDESVETDAQLPFSRAAITEHLQRARAALLEICEGRAPVRSGSLCETIERVAARLSELADDFKRASRPDAERLEDSLTSLEKMLDEVLLAALSSKEIASARAVTEKELEPYRTRMERATYDQTFDNLLLKHLREKFSVPRLSLFYL